MAATARPLLPGDPWLSGTNQNSIPANDNLLRLEVLSLPALSFEATQPAASEGELYVLSAAWGDEVAGTLAYYRDGAWSYWIPFLGQVKEVGGSEYQYAPDSSAEWQTYGGGGGATAFTDLSDVPGSYASQALKVVRVNAGETGLEFATGGSGDVAGPASATDNAVARFDSTTGKLLQSALITLSDLASNAVTFAIAMPAATTGASVAGYHAGLRAGAAVASTDTAGAAAGGDVQITAGDAARLTSGNANGGNISLTPGAGIGSGTTGQVLLGTNGTPSVPGLSFASDADTGFTSNASNQISISCSGLYSHTFTGTLYRAKSIGGIGWTSSSTASIGYPDTALMRATAAVVEVNNGTAGSYGQLLAATVRTNPTTFASLPAAGTAGAGARAFITDATATTFASVAAGGGANAVPVYSDGTQWLIG